VAGRGQEAGVGEGGESGEVAGKLTKIGSRWHKLWSVGEGRFYGGEEFGRPVAVEGKKLRMAGVAELGDGAAAEVMEDVLGEVKPAQEANVLDIREELVGGVDAEELDAGEVAHAVGGEALVE
jgi:hypothetical protein